MRRDHLPIEGYGAIGDLRSVALVGQDGAIDWCSLPGLECPSVFAALLDPERGGRFAVEAVGGEPKAQRYIEDTNVLETVFEVGDRVLTVTDFMPLSGSLEGSGGSRAEHAIYRLLEVEEGSLEARVEWSPRLKYGMEPTTLREEDGVYVARCESDLLSLTGLPTSAEVLQDWVGPVVKAHFLVEAGASVLLVTRWGSAERTSPDKGRKQLDETIQSWRAWVHKDEATATRSWAGEWSSAVIRSELALKLLINAETGAIAAAATTSLPEEIGGVRNWDYRMSWIRDAALVAQALLALGHRADAEAFIHWVEHMAATEGEEEWGLKIVYGLRSHQEMEERELVNLAGYRRSAPVRIGNEAESQLQLDVYGELLGAAEEFFRLDGELEPEVIEFLPKVADKACEAWQRPDYGIWEMRNGPFHLVHSKVMVWVALDRAIRLAEQGAIEGDTDRWSKSRSAVRAEILEKGYDEKLGAFKQAFERPVLDAANLRMPLFGFLPVDDPRVQATLDRTMEDLMEHGLVYRYRSDDGIAGGEGTFGACAFWLVDVLALAGRVEEARELFEGLVARSNHVGLYSEEIDAATGEFLGNFPQAYMHVSLINSTLYLAKAEGRELPIPSLLGVSDDRPFPQGMG
jgi:GH15 family glucan-1,4-alpha-glucosidase